VTQRQNAQAQAAAGADLPQFVKDEFDASLECGILAHGFLRLRCGCGHDKLLASSCNGRGFCPSRVNNMLCGSGELGVDLAQLIIAPTIAYKLNAQHSVGLSLLLGYQRIKASGLQSFDTTTASTAPGSVTNNGSDSSTGFGDRLEYQGQVAPGLTLGAAYAPKMRDRRGAAGGRVSARPTRAPRPRTLPPRRASSS
jgi:Transposase zinc-binding domain